MKILHLVRCPKEDYPFEIAGLQSGVGGHEVTVVLLQDAVMSGHPAVNGVAVFSGHEDLDARGLPAIGGTLDYDGIVKKIFEADRIINW